MSLQESVSIQRKGQRKKKDGKLLQQTHNVIIADDFASSFYEVPVGFNLATHFLPLS